MDIVDGSNAAAEEMPLGTEPEAAEPPARPPAEPANDSVISPIFRSAARATAQTLLLEIEELSPVDPNSQAEFSQEQALASQELSEGDAKALAEDDETAIQHYRQAWLHASTAKIHALRPKPSEDKLTG
ncbi:MAG: hypothetical protein HY735_17020 [Verrucomicrobia bacterium]|nr:hypothetical protein [Verrucomicrobiota bacterium]